MNRLLYCTICKKDRKMGERLVEWGDGISVNAFVCPVCGEQLISEREHKKAALEYQSKRNTLTLVRQLVDLGESIAVRIPRDIALKFGLKPKGKVELYTTKDAIIIKPA